MNRRLSRVVAASLGTACVLAVALVTAGVPATSAASDIIEPGRFVWRDLMTRDVAASKRFYGQLLGWRFEDVRRGDRPYVLARTGSGYVGGIVDVSAMPDAAAQWLCFMAVNDVDKSVALVQADGGKVLVPPRDLPVARVAVIADPQGAPLGVARLQRDLPVPSEPTTGHFFWQEYLARDDAQALGFYKRLAGYQSALTDSSLGIEYHVLRTSRGRAGLFRLPPATDVEPNWLPYVLVDDPAALAARVIALGGRILVPAAPDRRKGALVVIADSGGAPLALQKYPF
jgi:uncharacterized protein